jgi:nitrate/nitrite transporter NarK
MNTKEQKMKQVIKVKVGMAAVIVGIMGAMGGVGAVEAAMTVTEIMVGVGIAATSLMLMYAGVELVKD